MPQSSRVPGREAVALFRALSEAYESAPSLAERVERVLSATCGAVRARIGAATVIASPVAKERMKVVSSVEGGDWTANDRAMLTGYYARDDHEEDLVAKGIADLIRAGSSRLGSPMLRPEVVPDDRWYRSRHVNDFRRASDIDSCIYGGPPTNFSGYFCGLSFHRAWGDRAFSERDRQLVQLFQEGAAPLLNSYLRLHRAASALSQLSPRQKQLVDAFARGDSEKEAARRLGLRQTTLHSYAQHLYRRLDVRSKGELFAMLLKLGYRPVNA